MTLQRTESFLLTKLAHWHIIKAMTYKIVPNACGTLLKNRMPKYLLIDIVKQSAYLMSRTAR